MNILQTGAGEEERHGAQRNDCIDHSLAHRVVEGIEEACVQVGGAYTDVPNRGVFEPDFRQFYGGRVVVEAFLKQKVSMRPPFHSW